MKDEDIYSMNSEENRLKSFKKWPFGNDTNISKKKMAEAGFFFIGSKKEPDLVRCFVCQKELDGWEEGDSAWEEHKSHASQCQFVQLNKSSDEITKKEMHELEMHRVSNIAKKHLTKKVEGFKKESAKRREELEDIYNKLF